MIDLRLSDDQKQIVESVVSLLEDHSPVSRLRPNEEPQDVHFALAEMGWFGVGVSEDRDGLGLGLVEEALLFVEAGRFLLSPTVLASTLAARLCNDDHLPGLLSGELKAALALTSSDGTYVFDRGEATLLLAVEGDEIKLIPADAFSGETVTGFDETLTTEKGTLDRNASLSTAPAGETRLLVSAMLAGIAAASSVLSIDYAKVREQFGQPIGAFQAIKHMCADMGMRAYAAEAQVKLAALAMAEATESAPLQASAAALTASQAARNNAADAIQVHGGIGFTAECDAHVYLKRAHVLTQVLGGADACRSRVLAADMSENA